MASMMSGHRETAWGHMEEEQEEDLKIAQVEALDASPNTRVRFNKNRTVVRYPSEKSLLLEETPTIITDDDDDVVVDANEDNHNSEDGAVNDSDEDDEGDNEDKPNNVVAVNFSKNTSSIEASTNNSNGDMKKENNSIDTNITATAISNPSRSWFQRAQGVQRYTPRFTPPAPQEQVDNGEDESDEEEEDDESDEEGYDSVVEESGSEGEDPIKKIAEESLVSTKKKLQELSEQKGAHKPSEVWNPTQGTSGAEQVSQEASERAKILQEVAQLKDQLRNEVEKVELASNAASAAAAKAEEESVSFTSRLTSMRHLLAVLCGCGARIVGMLVATKLLDAAATHMQPYRSITPVPLLRLLLPISPHLILATGVSMTHTLLRVFHPCAKWWWLACVESPAGGLLSMCAARGAGGIALGYAVAAGCIVGIIASTS